MTQSAWPLSQVIFWVFISFTKCITVMHFMAFLSRAEPRAGSMTAGSARPHVVLKLKQKFPTVLYLNRQNLNAVSPAQNLSANLPRVWPA